MKNYNRKIFYNVVGLVVIILVVAFAHYAIDKTASTFIEIRKSEARIVVDLVKNNWQGITSISEQQKNSIIDYYDPSLVGVDISNMKFLALFILYVAMGAIALDKIIGLIKLIRKSRPRAQRGRRSLRTNY